MADFVDYTNATELEKFTFKLGLLMKEMAEKDTIEQGIVFRGVDFRLSRMEAKEDLILQGIPHFRFGSQQLEKCFDLPRYWLLECVEKGRVVSEATGRLLLSSLIQNANEKDEMAMFVRIGEVEVSESFLGFRRRLDCCEYFETYTDAGKRDNDFDDDDFKMTSAQVVLEWFPGNLRVNYPGFTGHFDSCHPIERIQVRCIWPKIPKEGIKFKREELIAAPIWVASYELVEEAEMLPLRNSMLRSIHAAHLREVLFTSMGEMPLISIPVVSKERAGAIDSARALYEAIALVYRNETERLENDVTSRFSFIPKRVLEAMRWERLNEALSSIWRRFVKTVEGAWNDLQVLDLEICEGETGEIEKGLKLVNWCIERELEWQDALKEHALLRKLYRIPSRYLYKNDSIERIDAKIDAMKEKLEINLGELNKVLSDSGDEVFEDVIEEAAEDEMVDDCMRVFEHEYELGDYCIYEPVILNCEPPPSKLLTRSLLQNPLAGDVIAMNQLREDMRVFRAWNERICGVKCAVDEADGGVTIDSGDVFDLGFIGFLIWHSPNDVERGEAGQPKVSQRMRDTEGQWLKLWQEQSNTTSNSHAAQMSLNQQVSFNHRAMLGQVLSDLTLKIDLNQLLESVTPFVNRRAAELLSSEAVEIVRRLEGEVEDGKYPLDLINAELDEFEKQMTRSLTLQALCSQIFSNSAKEVLVSGAEEREFLMNRQHEFKVVRKEVVEAGKGFKELLSGFEGIRINLPY